MAGLQSVLNCFRPAGAAPEAAPITMRQTTRPTDAVLSTPLPRQIAAESARSADYFAWAAMQLPQAEREAISTTYAGQASPILKHNPATAARTDPTLPEVIAALPTHAPHLLDGLVGSDVAPLLVQGLAAAFVGILHQASQSTPFDLVSCGMIVATIPILETLCADEFGGKRPSWAYTIFPALMTGASMLTNPQDLMGSLAVAATAFISSIPLFAKEPIAVFKNQIAAWQRAQLVRSAFDHVQSMDPRRRLVEEPAVLSTWAQKQATECEDPAKKAQWELIAAAAEDLTHELERFRSALLSYLAQQLEDGVQVQEFSIEGDGYSSLMNWRGAIYDQSLALYQRAEALLVLDEDSQSANANEG